jgi:hypothetical protein
MFNPGSSVGDYDYDPGTNTSAESAAAPAVNTTVKQVVAHCEEAIKKALSLVSCPAAECEPCPAAAACKPSEVSCPAAAACEPCAAPPVFLPTTEDLLKLCPGETWVTSSVPWAIMATIIAVAICMTVCLMRWHLVRRGQDGRILTLAGRPSKAAAAAAAPMDPDYGSVARSRRHSDVVADEHPALALRILAEEVEFHRRRADCRQARQEHPYDEVNLGAGPSNAPPPYPGRAQSVAPPPLPPGHPPATTLQEQLRLAAAARAAAAAARSATAAADKPAAGNVSPSSSME